MTSSIPIPCVKSRFLPEVLRLDSEESAESEDDEQFHDAIDVFVPSTTTTFFVDKTPSNPISQPQQEHQVSYDPSKKERIKLSSSLDPGTTLKGYLPNGVKETMDFMNQSSDAEKIFQEKCLLIKEGFHTDMSINPKVVSKRIAKRERKKQREATAGKEWFNMAAREMDEELEKDIQLINMRDALDRSRFYKRNSGMKEDAKYLHVGTIVGTQADYYNDLTRRQRKRTLVEELMNEGEVREWQKKKFSEIIKTNPHYLKMKRKMENKKKKMKTEEKVKEQQLLEKKRIIRLKREQKKQGVSSIFDRVAAIKKRARETRTTRKVIR